MNDAAVISKFVESEHPRVPAGTTGGGEFTAGQTSGTVVQGESHEERGHEGTGVPSTAAGLEAGRAPLQIAASVAHVNEGGNDAIRKGAASYCQEVGIAPPAINVYAPLDPDRAKRIAAAYEAMPVDDHSPETEAAYRQLGKEIQQQWDFAEKKMGIQYESWTKPGQPYANSKEMCKDLLDNKHLFFFQGGSEPNKFLAEKDEHGLSINDKFRAIHDTFGHASEGFQFGPRGEENAWLKHSQMFSPLAQRALTTETRGQNSWVNFGPQNFNTDGSNKNIPPAERPYAVQKSALLPDWATEWKPILTGEPVSKSDAKHTVAFDFDGTLAQILPGEFAPDKLGPPLQKPFTDDSKRTAMDELRSCIAAGTPVVIFTARATDPANIPYIRDWLIAQGLPGTIPITNEKTPDIGVIYDDRARQINPDNGELVKNANTIAEYVAKASGDTDDIQFYRDDHYGPSQSKTVFMSKLDDHGNDGLYMVYVRNGQLNFMRTRMLTRIWDDYVKHGRLYPCNRQEMIDWHAAHPDLIGYYSEGLSKFADEPRDDHGRWTSGGTAVADAPKDKFSVIPQPDGKRVSIHYGSTSFHVDVKPDGAGGFYFNDRGRRYPFKSDTNAIAGAKTLLEHGVLAKAYPVEEGTFKKAFPKTRTVVLKVVHESGHWLTGRECDRDGNGHGPERTLSKRDITLRKAIPVRYDKLIPNPFALKHLDGTAADPMLDAQPDEFGRFPSDPTLKELSRPDRSVYEQGVRHDFKVEYVANTMRRYGTERQDVQ